MLPKIKGKVAYVFDEADFDTDLICGMDTCTVADPEILKRVCMQDIAPDFQKYVEPGDVVVCGENFGYGHTYWWTSGTAGTWNLCIYCGVFLPGILSCKYDAWDDID